MCYLFVLEVLLVDIFLEELGCLVAWWVEVLVFLVVCSILVAVDCILTWLCPNRGSVVSAGSVEMAFYCPFTGCFCFDTRLVPGLVDIAIPLPTYLSI